MRIVYITYDDVSSNFAWSTHVKSIINRLCNKGHKILLIAPVPKYFVQISADFYYWKKPNNIICKILWYYFTSLFCFIREINKFKAEVIYIRGAHITVIPIIAALYLRLPIIVEINGLVHFEIKSKTLKLISKITQNIYFRFCSKIITVSDTFKKGISKYFGASFEKITVIENGVDLSVFKPMDNYSAKKLIGWSTQKTYGLFIGSFYKHHYLQLIVNSVKYLDATNMEICFIGDGSERLTIEKLASKNSDRIKLTFLGEVKHEEIPIYIASSDFCLLILKKTYSYYGPSTVKLFEYMACNKHIICATDIPEVFNFVNDNKVGNAIKITNNFESDSKNLAALIKTRDVEKENKPVNYARTLCEKYFNWDRACDDVERELINAAKK